MTQSRPLTRSDQVTPDLAVRRHEMLRNARMGGADLSRAKLIGAKIQRKSLKGVTLDGVAGLTL